MLSQKQKEKGLSAKEEKLARELYNSVLDRNMLYWKEEGVISVQALEAKKMDLWLSCCKIIQETAPYALAISRIQKMLRNHYGQEFSVMAQEIQIGTVTEQEFTRLAITLQNMFTQGTNQEAVRAVLMPYIERNDAHMKVQLQEAQENTEKIRLQREAAERATEKEMLKREAAERAAAIAKQEAAGLKEQLAQLLAAGQALQNVAALTEAQKMYTGLLEEKKRTATTDVNMSKKQHLNKDDDSDEEEIFTPIEKPKI